MKVSEDKTNKLTHTPILKNRLFSWIKLLVLGMALEAILRENLYSFGINIIEKIQYNINENYLMISLLRVLSFMATKDCLIILIFLTFNYFDMYTTLIVVEVCGCCSIGTGLFKLIYKNPRPFFHEEWVKVYDCETGYGNPSGHSIVVVSTYLTFWKIFKLKYHINPKLRKYLFALLCTFIFSVLFSRLALGVHSLNQIFLGSFIGYQIYSLIFYVLNINLDLELEIKSLINYHYLNIMAAVMTSLLLFGFVVFNFFPLSMNLDVDKYLQRILETCPGTPYSKVFDYEAYFMLSSCSILLGAYYGIYYDIKVNLKSSDEWVQINTGKFLWNKTSVFKSFIRILVMASVLIVPFLLTVFISSHAHTNIIFILKNLVPYFVISFCLFAFVRKACDSFHCTNKLVKETKSAN